MSDQHHSSAGDIDPSAQGLPADAPARPQLTSVRARLVMIIFLALLPAFVLMLAVSGLERSRAHEAATAEALATSRLLRNQYYDIVLATQRHMIFMAEFPEIATGGPEECRLRLNSILNLLDDFLGFTVTDAEGFTFCAASPIPITDTIDSRGEPYYELTKERGRFTVTGMGIGRRTGQPYLSFSLPFFDENGQLTRIFSAGRDVNALNARLAGADFPADSAMIFTDLDGTVIMRSPDPEEFIGRQIALDAVVVEGRDEGLADDVNLDGVERTYAYSTVYYNGEPLFYVLVGYSDERIYGGAERTLRASLIGLAIISLVALAAAWLSAEAMIVRRIGRLAEVANQMRRGNLKVRTGMANDQSEFGQLAVAFDSLAQDLDERIQENERLLAETKSLNSSLEQRVEVRTQQLQTSNARLLSTQAELRRLSRELMQATEQERTRIAREIHDQLGQMLTAIKMELRSTKRKAAGGAPIDAKIDDINLLVDETIQLVRRISSDLRPGILDDFGLAAAVDWQLQEFEKRTDIHYDLQADVDETRISSVVGIAAFRILQESLTNVMRHAHATKVTVRLTADAEHLTMLVQDNGRGITAEEQATTRSLGLLGMRERAVQLGGSLTLDGAPGQGTTVLLVLPLDDAGQPAERHKPTDGNDKPPAPTGMQPQINRIGPT